MWFSLFIILVFVPFISMAQHLGHLYPEIVFIDDARVRDQPALSSNIKGVLSHNHKVEHCNARVKQDTIKGMPGKWMKIKEQDTIGFIWRPLMADAVLASKIDQSDTFLLQRESPGALKFKVFRKGKFFRGFNIHTSDSGEVYGFISYGKTWNSKGKEILAVRFEARNYLLLEWDGNSLKKSDIKLRDASLLTGEYVPFDSAI